MQNKFSKLTILYVEDDVLIRKNARIYLNSIFKEVFGAKDGLDALNVFYNEKPDIIISDIKMPQLNGLDMAKKIRQNDKKTPIILATAYTDTSYLIKAVELGLVKYLIKPITPLKLNEALNLAYAQLYENDNRLMFVGQNSVYDTLNKNLIIDGINIKLTKKELLLLDILAKNHQRAVSYQEIENHIWLDSSMSRDTLRSLVSSLRHKLQCSSIIENISGIGYKLEN